MGLGQSINNALGGLRATQAGIELASRNVSNANTEGYTKKSLSLINNVVGDKSFGVQIGAVTRQVDRFLQGKVRAEYSEFNMLDVKTPFLDYIDNLFGKPGADGSLDVVVNNVSQALVDLANDPQQGAARQQVVENADFLASHLREMSAQIQAMRQDAEHMIAQEVANANNALMQIARINHELTINGSRGGLADLKDQLDNHVDDLAAIFDIKTIEDSNGAVRVYTKSGTLLADQNASRLEFDEHPNITAQQLYSRTDAERSVGTIVIDNGSGGGIDLLLQGSIRGGKVAGLIELRDKILTSAQDQLDELAHGMAMAFNTIHNEGTAVTSGADTGFKLDISAMSDGNVVEFNYKDNATGFNHTISFVKVSDASVLPLADTVTANGADTVYGIDFSGGLASVQAQIAAAITGENPNFTVTLVSGTDIQILDDGAGNQVDVLSVNGTQTASGVQGEGSELNLFTDYGDYGEVNYSNSMAGDGQKLGFAARIRVNTEIKNDSTLLVKSTGTTSIGDQTRPADMLKLFTETSFYFNANSGIGSQSAPFSGTIDSFTRQVVSDQTSKIGRHTSLRDNQELLLSALNGRLEAKTKVNVDQEMADLLVLQTAYNANARIVSVVKELMDALMRM